MLIAGGAPGRSPHGASGGTLRGGGGNWPHPPPFPTLLPDTRGFLPGPRSAGGAQGKGTREWSGIQRRWEQPCRWSFLRRARLAAEGGRDRQGVREVAGNALR